MKVNIYAIWDSKVKAYLQPWFSPNHASAFRNCEKAGRSPSSPFHDFPADFTLMCLGSFDDETGELFPFEKLESLGTFLQFMPPVQPNASESAVADTRAA